MSRAAQILTLVVILGVTGGSLYLMNMLFGLFGVALTVVFLLPVIGVVYYVSSGDGGDTTRQGRRSKGAQQEE